MKPELHEPAPATATVAVNLSYLVPICLAATFGGLLFGYDTGVISGAIEPLTARFGLGDAMKGWASGCVLVGCAGGVLLVGPLSDWFGRKPALLLSAAMFFASAIGTAIPGEIWAFIAFRILGGVGIGIASISTPMYIAEVTPAHIRGRMVAVNQIAIVVGLAATSIVNYYVARSGDEAWLISTGWRWMFATGVVPAVAFAFLLLPIPESPRWMIEMGRDSEARAILTRVGGAGFAQSEYEGVKAAVSRESGDWRSLLSPRLRRPLLIGIALAVLQQVTGINVFMYFGATIFRNLSASTGVDAGLLQQAIINGACVVFTLVAIASVDRWGRRPLMLLGAAGMGASLLGMGAMAQFMTDRSATSGWMLVCIVLYIAAFGLSVGPVVWVILSEIFPTAVRGRALGLAAFFLGASDYAVTQTFPMMDAAGSWFVRRMNHAFPFYVYAGFCAVLGLVVWRLVPETKGRTLEEIEEEWCR
jgi:sugar porter (SP) family MFS transporter